MRSLLLTTAALIALAAGPAFAQTVPAEPAPAPTGDPVVDRLNALEARVRQLEARNAQLEQQAAATETRVEAAEKREARQVQFGWGPTLNDDKGDFTFKPRGVIEADYGVFNERSGGYDYNDGTAFRRARIGLEGTAMKVFNYRIEVDFAGNQVGITDAYLQYAGIEDLLITAGQHKAPFGLESNNSDNYNIFLERGMFTNAFGNAGAERRIGLSAAWAPRDNLNLAVGLFGDNESITRSTGAPVTDSPDESLGANARLAWEPVSEKGRILHLGLSGYYRTNLKSGDVADAVRLSDRPNIRIDNGNIADTGIITGVDSLRYAGAEAAAVFGPLTLAGEYGRLWTDRPGLADPSFDGFYVYATYFLTGESRPFRNGNFDRVKPKKPLGGGGAGAFELAFRYDRLDLSDTPVLARAGNRAESVTFGLNWYLNPYAKLLFNWVRFNGTNSPLDPVGTRTAGDALATRLHVDF
jgi:phosphate-selective porin OprO/OprP